MSKRQQIEFIIKRDGTVEERISGVAGSDCQAVTEGIERALGEITHRDHTSDYYLQDEGQGASEVVSNNH